MFVKKGSFDCHRRVFQDLSSENYIFYFTVYLQNKSFIYCGKPFGEEDVIGTIKSSYAGSEFRQAPPTPEDLESSDKSFLQIVRVEPVAVNPFKTKKVHYNILEFFKHNAVDTFTYQKASF